MQCDALQPVRSPVSARSREYSDFKPDYSDQHRRLRVEGYVEGYVLNVGLEGNSQNRQEAGFSFLVRGTLAGQCGTQRERKQEEGKTGKGLI